MNIIVLNGSPKGALSGTMQYVAYLAKAYPQHQFTTIPIAQQLNSIENNPEKFKGIINQIRAADGVLWAFPLYFMLVHGNYKRFIELVFERDAAEAFHGKYCASISTSIHFFDHTAHNYMHAISDDLRMKYVGAFSPDMVDLLNKNGQKQLLQFGRYFLETMEKKVPIQRHYAPLTTRDFNYTSGTPQISLDAGNKKVLILHDAQENDHNLQQMITHAQACFAGQVQVINLHEVNIKGGCQGCMQCGGSYHCSYEGKDGFIEFYKENVMQADILIYGATIRDRYLSSRWKTLFDRSFFNTHTPVLQNKQLVYLISGPLEQIPSLRQMLIGYLEFQGANLVNIVSDANGTSVEIDQYIEQSLQNALAFSSENVTRPMSFLGQGGMRIFRDEIWGRLRMVFPADYKAFRKLGYYKTFPQNSFLNFIMRVFGVPILSIPAIRKGFNRQMKEQMIMPLKHVVEKASFD